MINKLTDEDKKLLYFVAKERENPFPKKLNSAILANICELLASEEWEIENMVSDHKDKKMYISLSLVDKGE